MQSAAQSIMRVVVSSSNPVKIESTRRAFCRAFPQREIEMISVCVPSGVPDQPMGDDQTRQGALNRASNALHSVAARGDSADFYVGLEGGCVFAAPVELPPPESAQSSLRASAQELSCFAWGIVIKRGCSKVGAARTASFQLPESVAQLVSQGMELGVADDKVFGRIDSKREGGSVGLLTGGLIDRTAYYEHAMTLALVPFLDCNQGLY